MVDDENEKPLNIIVEIKGYRREAAKAKKSTEELDKLIEQAGASHA